MGRLVVIAIAADALLPSAARAAPTGACDTPAPALIKDRAVTATAKARKPANTPKPATPRRYILM